MSDYLEIALPYPPSVNHYWRHTKAGTHYISKEGKAFREQVYRICRVVNARFLDKVAIQIAVFPPDNRRRDIDNILKALLDGLVHGKLIEDDSLIMQLHIEKFEPRKDGLVVVKIKEWANAD